MCIRDRAGLDALGEVRVAADALHIHPNTLRYRVRRAEQLTGIDPVSYTHL